MNQEINGYKKSIDTLQAEFQKMLQDTLTKIRAKIELDNKQWDAENDNRILRGLEETVKNTSLGN